MFRTQSSIPIVSTHHIEEDRCTGPSVSLGADDKVDCRQKQNIANLMCVCETDTA